MTRTKKIERIREHEMTESQKSVIDKAYDTIAAIWQQQDRVVEFDLCYGDGTRFAGTKKEGVRIIWDTMREIVETGEEYDRMNIDTRQLERATA